MRFQDLRSGFWIPAITSLLMLMLSCSGSEPPSDVDAAAAIETTDAAVEGGRINAADAYARVQDQMGDEFLNAYIEMGLNTPLSESEVKHLLANQALVRQLIEASKIEYCDFGPIDFDAVDRRSRVVRMLLCAKLLQWDAHRCIRAPSGHTHATERLEAVIRIARHLGDQRSIVPKLLALSCLDLSLRAIPAWRERLNHPTAKARLRSALENARHSEMFNARAAFELEFANLRSKIERSNGFVEIASLEIAVHSSERAPLIEELDRRCRAMIDAFDKPNADQEIRRIVESTKLRKARAFLGGFESVARNMRRAQGLIDSAISAVGE